MQAKNRASEKVSTHSRPKAAGSYEDAFNSAIEVSTHSRPKAAGFCSRCSDTGYLVSTHSRPKAAGMKSVVLRICHTCFNTQPPEGGWRFQKKQL